MKCSGNRYGLWGDTPGTTPSATSSRLIVPGTIREICLSAFTLASPPWVWYNVRRQSDEVARKHGTEEAAAEYLNYLYSDEAQTIEAQNFYRPSTKKIYDEFVLETDSSTITEIPADGHWINDKIILTDITHFGGWTQARSKHFSDGAYFDQIYEQ